MRTQQIILAVVLAFIVVLAGLTIVAEVKGGGPDILGVTSLLVIALFGFGIIGALREPPDE